MSMKENKQDINKFWERLGIPVCSPSEAWKVLELCVSARQSVNLIAEAGTGKTQMLKQFAAAPIRDWNAVFMYLAHLEREDIGGYAYPSSVDKHYEFFCEKSMKKVMASTKPTLLVFDEWNRGEKSVMNAAFTVMEARRWGSETLPDHVYIASAMNPSEANYLVNEVERDPAFRRRLVMVAMQANITSFLEHARGLGNFHPLVVGYLTAQPQSLTDVASREAGKVYANPAAWEKISDGLKKLESQGVDLTYDERLLHIWGSGIIGMGMMSQFMSYVRENASVINPFDIMEDYNRLARQRVHHLVQINRNDAYGEISDSLAVAIISSREDEKVKGDLSNIARNVSEYLVDLPREGVIAFLTKLGKHATAAGSQAEEFHLEFSDELSQQEAYNRAINTVVVAQEKAEAENDKYSPGGSRVKSR